MSQPAITVSDLMIYPIKSTRGVQLTEAHVVHRGFHGDRRWMIVDSDYLFITQRQFPRMALISVNISETVLELSAPGMDSVEVPTPSEDQAAVTATVWKDQCSALDAGDSASQWLSYFLNTPCRLVYMPEHSRRQVDLRYGRAGDITSFADGFPFLVTTEASLVDLNQRLTTPVTMRHFRPNIVLSGTDTYEEDGWKRIQIGDIIFNVAKPCSRCVMTTVNPNTGQKMGKDPLLTLSQYRRTDMGIIFGQNLVQENTGLIHVGDPVTVLDSHYEHYR